MLYVSITMAPNFNNSRAQEKARPNLLSRAEKVWTRFFYWETGESTPAWLMALLCAGDARLE